MTIAQAIYPTRNAFFLITFLQFQLSLLFLFDFSKNRWLNFNKSYTIVSVPENHFQRKIAFQRWSSGGWEFPTVVQIQCNTFEFAVFFSFFFAFLFYFCKLNSTFDHSREAVKWLLSWRGFSKRKRHLSVYLSLDLTTFFSSFFLLNNNI